MKHRWLLAFFQNCNTNYQDAEQYFGELMSDKAKLMDLHPTTFSHLGALLDREIHRVIAENVRLSIHLAHLNIFVDPYLSIIPTFLLIRFLKKKFFLLINLSPREG